MAFTIGNRREVLWDGALVEESLTTALLTQGGLGDGERVFTFDMPWEETCLGYTCLCRDPKGYKLYYKSHTVKADGSWDKMYISVLESEDGFSWRRPALSLVPFPGHPVNNIVRDDIPDNFFVFYDTNPACPKEERYKAVGRAKEDGGPLRLICHVSEDGYVFRDGWELTRKGYFDTLNTVHFKDGKYTAYVRNFHYPKYPKEGVDYTHWNNLIRSITVMESEDFRHWSDPVELEYEDEDDYPLYTNQVISYYRAPHMRIGFPTRYVERPAWTENFDQLCDPAFRRRLMDATEVRSGLAITDCIFMSSRDGRRFHRFGEAFITPGYENPDNWVYGDCYPAYGLVEGEGGFDYMYQCLRYRSVGPRPLIARPIRKDGFACYRAGKEEARVVTKSLVYEGDVLHLNFETAVPGYIYVSVFDEEGNALSEESFEVFGNTVDRRVTVKGGFAPYQGRPVRLSFRMREARLYSFQFE